MDLLSLRIKRMYTLYHVEAVFSTENFMHLSEQKRHPIESDVFFIENHAFAFAAFRA